MLPFYLSLLETQEDKDKFDCLYERYSPLLKQVANQILQDESLAEDAVHTAFLKIIKNFYKIGEISGHKTRRFLVIITENVAVDMLRKNRRASHIDLEGMTLRFAETPDMLDGIVVQELVRVIEDLPEMYRTVLEMRAYYGMSEKQIATALNIGYSAARKRLQRARAMLAADIKKRQEGERYESVSK